MEYVLNASRIGGVCMTPSVTGEQSVVSKASVQVSAARGSQDHSGGHVQYVVLFQLVACAQPPFFVVVGSGSGDISFTQQNWEVQRATKAFVCFLRTHVGFVDSLARPGDWQVAAGTVAASC